MIYMLHGHERSKHSAIFEQLFKLRYEVFIKLRGWSLPTRNGLEIDQYDIDDAVYIIDIGPDNEIKAHARLTPTMKASLLADYFPHLVENGTNPRGQRIYEATRFMVLPTQRDKTHYKAVKARFLAAATEWCLANDISHMQTVIDAGTLPAYVEVSLLTTPLGLSHPFGGGKGVAGGGECLAFRLPICRELLDDIKAFGAIPDSGQSLWQPMPLQAA